MRVSAWLMGLFLMQVAAVAQAADDGWYGAVDLGKTSFQDVGETRLPPLWQFNTVDDGGAGSRLSIGRRFNDFFGWEASYLDLGEAGFDSRGPLPVDSGDPLPPGPTRRDVKIEASALAFTGVGTYPFSEAWSLSGRLAFIRGHLKVRGQESGNGVNRSYEDSSGSFKFSYGFSVNWALSQTWTARLGWDHYDVGDTVSTGSYAVNMTSLGLVYHF